VLYSFERAPCWRLHPQARPVVVHESGIALFRTLTPTGRRDQPSVGARVRFRHEPPAFYGFLQTSPLADDALAIRILFPMNRARSLTSSDWVCQLRWANKKASNLLRLLALEKWAEGDLNPRHQDFQSCALPTELSTLDLCRQLLVSCRVLASPAPKFRLRGSSKWTIKLTRLSQSPSCQTTCVNRPISKTRNFSRWSAAMQHSIRQLPRRWPSLRAGSPRVVGGAGFSTSDSRQIR
jgi:hypothetical protein